MKRKSKKRIVTLLLTAIMLAGIIPANVFAASPMRMEYMQVKVSDTPLVNPDFKTYGNPNGTNLSRDSSYLKNCNISAAYMSYGLYIQTETGTTKEASELGVKDIKVQQKNGIFWNTIATSNGGSIKNDDTFCGSCQCTNAVDGQTYRVKCTHYAYIDGNYYHYDHTTISFTYVKP